MLVDNRTTKVTSGTAHTLYWLKERSYQLRSYGGGVDTFLIKSVSLQAIRLPEASNFRCLEPLYLPLLP